MDIIVITNRHLCGGISGLLNRLELLAQYRPSRIILREKDMSEEEYEGLARSCRDICTCFNLEFSIHSFFSAARRLDVQDIHLPFSVLAKNPSLIHDFKTVGVSVHSTEEAVVANCLGASYVIAGHIFQTDCKKNLPPRGTAFLSNICTSSTIPVFAVGGITPQLVNEIKNCGAAGICVMSGMMRGENYKDFFTL